MGRSLAFLPVKKALLSPHNPFVKIFRQRWLYLLLLPGLIYFIIFRYMPMYGILIAFKDYRPIVGILSSPWAGLKYFQRLFSTGYTWTLIYNTLRLSVLKIVIGFPIPVIFALLLNEITYARFKKIVQTVSYLPHFLSWVVVTGLTLQVFSPRYGLYGVICQLFGLEKGVPLSDPYAFLAILVGTDIWKEFGYGAIIYLAAISGVGEELYEAARIDGANRFKQCLYITLPGILPVIAMMFILRLGGILDAGFDQVLNLYAPVVYSTSDILDTFVYRVGLLNFEFSFSTAVGLCKSAVGAVLVVSANWIVGKFTDRSIW